MSEDKIQYEPSQVKRFEISKDRYSRERLQALRVTIKELRSKHPFIISAVLFGSLSKGKQLNEDTEGQSDIDAVIYIDEDEARKEYSSLSGGKNEIFNEWIAVDREMHAQYEYRTEDEKCMSLLATI